MIIIPFQGHIDLINNCMQLTCIPSKKPNIEVLLGILQNMVNASLTPTQPEGSELPTFRYGGEGIPRVLKQYRFFPYGYIFPIRWSNQLNQSDRLIYASWAWIITDSSNGLVSSLCQAIAWTNFDL